MEKREVRNRMRRLRREVPPPVRSERSVEICERILARADVQTAVGKKGAFAVYLASPDEIDLSALIERLWDAGCPVVVPAWRGGVYELVRYARDTRLIEGPMGILEPMDDGKAAVSPTVPSVWIVPGLAFAGNGTRLGYGGGWYDRFLSAASPEAVSLGVGYSFQMLDSVPVLSHDVFLTDVVTA